MFYVPWGLMKRFSGGFLISISLRATDLECLIRNLIFKDDRAFRLLHQEIPQIFVLCSLTTCCQNLETKTGVTGKIWEKTGLYVLRDLTEKSVNFSTTCNIRLLLFFGKVDQ